MKVNVWTCKFVTTSIRAEGHIPTCIIRGWPCEKVIEDKRCAYQEDEDGGQDHDGE